MPRTSDRIVVVLYVARLRLRLRHRIKKASRKLNHAHITAWRSFRLYQTEACTYAVPLAYRLWSKIYTSKEIFLLYDRKTYVRPPHRYN